MAVGSGTRWRAWSPWVSVTACLLAASGLTWAPVADAADAASATPPMTPAGFRLAGVNPSPADPLRVWIVGDSVMHDSSPAITASLAATGDARVVADSSFGGWGLTTQAAWVADSQQIIATYHPEVVIGTWSWDDLAAGDDRTAYTALLRQALSVWMAPGDGVEAVVLIQFPQVGPNLLWPAGARRRVWAEQTREQDDWDTIAHNVVGDFPGHAVYLSTSSLFAPDGRFFTWAPAPDGGWVRARQIDNTHLCPPAAAEMTQLVVSDLAPALGLAPPASGWESGAWTEDPRYDEGTDSCPADQPPAGYVGVRIPDLPAYPVNPHLHPF